MQIELIFIADSTIITSIEHGYGELNILVSRDSQNQLIFEMKILGKILDSDQQEHVWCSMKNGLIKIFNALNVENPEEVYSLCVNDEPTKMHYHTNSGNMFIALRHGDLILMEKESGYWIFDRTEKITLKHGKEISCMQSMSNWIYASCGNTIYVLDGVSGDILKFFDACDVKDEVRFMEKSGVGLW